MAFKLGNFNIDYNQTALLREGYFDLYNFESLSDSDKETITKRRRNGIPQLGSNDVYEFIINPNDPFLNENSPLPPGIELKISFDRLQANHSTYLVNGKTDT